MDPSNSSSNPTSSLSMPQTTSSIHPSHQLPSPSPISPGFPPNIQHSSSSSTSTSYQSSSSSLLPSLPVGIEATLASAGAPNPRSSHSAFPPPIIPFDPNAASDDDDDEDEMGSPRKKRRAAGGAKNGKGSGTEGNGASADDKGRRKIEIEYIQKKEKRHITFSKRKAGIMKKVSERK